MKIYLIRHAQSKRNVKIKSKVDTRLTLVGEEQAKRLGGFFKGVKIDKIYCSPLKRAKTTLDKIKIFVRGVPIVYPKEIVEIKMGKHEKEGKDDWGTYFREAKASEIPYHLYVPRGGESLQDCYDRAGNFYVSLLKKHKSKDIVVLIGHGFFLLYFILNALGLDLFESQYYQLSNASVSMLDVNKKGKVKNFYVNDYHHLIYEGMKIKGVRK